jgi:hypothetical protein
LLTVLFFAIIYTGIVNQFYHSTSKYENILNEELMIIENEIETSISENFRDYYKSSVIYLDENKNWIFCIDDLEIKKINLNVDELIFDISVHIRNMSDFETKYTTTFYFKVNREDKFSKIDYVYRLGRVSFKDNTIYVPELKNINFSQIFYLQSSNIKKERVGLRLSNKLEKNINAFINSTDGLPSRNKENSIARFKLYFPRMLYLSMVTITTLGYGDIVPLTNTARILIGIESTLGIIIMGWFVNSKVNSK